MNMIRRLRFLWWLCCVTALLTACSEPERTITSLEDAREASIGVMTGSTGEHNAEKFFPDATVQRFDFSADAVTAMNAGQLDAAIVARTEAWLVTSKHPGITYVEEPIAMEHSAIAVRKGRDSLLTALNGILGELKETGVLKEMQDRWFRYDGQPYPEITVPVVSEGEPLVVGTNAAHEPFGFLDKHKQFVGFDAELGRHLALGLGRPVVFKDMVFSGLLPALVSGKIDMIIADLTVTEERRHSVDFTIPYFENACVLLVHRPKVSITEAPDDKPALVASVWGPVAESFHRNIIQEKRYLLILSGLKITLIITICLTLLGTVLGAGVCALRMSRHRLMQKLAMLYISVLRGTPVLVLLMIVYYVVFASVNISALLVAVIAFSLNMAAYVSEMFRTGIESVDRGQIEAGIALGFSRYRTFVHIVLPQAVRRIVPVYIGELISQMKMTSVVGYIAVQDLTKVGDIIRSRTFDAFFPLIMVAVMYFLIAWLLMVLMKALERRIDPRARLRRAQV